MVKIEQLRQLFTHLNFAAIYELAVELKKTEDNNFVEN